jgi:hypothetical protein
LTGAEARTTAIFSGSGAHALANLDAYADDTGAFVDPSVFGASGLCGTGLDGAGRIPDASGRCPLVFMIFSLGTGVGAAIVRAITLAAGI